MRHARREAERQRVRDARLALAALLGLSTLTNAILGLGLVHHERVTVLVPAVTGPAWEVGETWAGRRYLEDAARTVAATLLTLTPENAPAVREAAARMSHASARGAIGAWVAAEAERMASLDLASAFHPERITTDIDALAAEVTGTLATFIGREETSRVRKTYRLVFRLDAGRLGLLRFEERKEE